MQVSNEVNDRRVIEALTEVVERGRRLGPVLRSIGRDWLSRVQLLFRSQHSPYGQPWAETLRGGQILSQSRRLRDSIDYIADDEELALGTNVRYAGVHQYGATIRARNAPYLVFRVGGQFVRKREVTIPQRQYLPTDGLPEAWAESALAKVQEHLTA
ncbi:MAG: phage virion morphogenesis protein [Polyangiales bacterium]